jgi:hypothetical protein
MITKGSIALLLLTIAFFLGNMVGYGQTRMTFHNSLPQNSSDPLRLQPIVQVEPIDLLEKRHNGSQAKEYEKLERTRKRSEVLEKIEGLSIQNQAIALGKG